MENMHHDEANSKKHMSMAMYIQSPIYSNIFQPFNAIIYTYLGHFATIYNIFNIGGWDF